MRALASVVWHIALAGLLAVAAPAQAQATRRLGVFFWHDSPNDIATWTGIRAGLTAAGLPAEFVERRADSDAARAVTCLSELRDARCELVFAMGTQSALLAKERLRDVPVVFAAVSNAVASGVVADWRGSGTNVCGASNWIDPANVLEVFRLAVPHLDHLGVLRSKASGVVSAAEVATMRDHLTRPGTRPLELREALASDAADVPRAVRELVAAGVDAIWIPIDLTIYRDIGAVRNALGDARVPLLSTAATGVRDGAVAGTTVDYELHGRRAAAIALDVLVRGRDPGSLPVDRMRSSLVLVNLAAARQNRVELPLSLLVLADELLDPEAPHGAGR